MRAKEHEVLGFVLVNATATISVPLVSRGMELHSVKIGIMLKPVLWESNVVR